MPIATPTPAERFAAILRWLSKAVAAQSGGDRLSLSLIALIIGRLRTINQRVARLAARIRDGRYAFRSVAPPCRGTATPRQPNKLPQNFGWLLTLVPEAVGSRSQLEHLLRDADMAVLLAAAPASLARPIRSLCRMLRLQPPEILAPPARPRPPRKTAAAAPKEPPEPRPEPPAWPPRRTRWSPTRIRGSPRSA